MKSPLFRMMLLACILSNLPSYAKNYRVSSPDKSIVVEIEIEDQIRWSTSVNGIPILVDCIASLTLDNETLTSCLH